MRKEKYMFFGGCREERKREGRRMMCLGASIVAYQHLEWIGPFCNLFRIKANCRSLVRSGEVRWRWRQRGREKGLLRT